MPFKHKQHSLKSDAGRIEDDCVYHDQTVLGTPVPVATSTVTQKKRGARILSPTLFLSENAVPEQDTYVIEGKHHISSNEDSVLNIQDMQDSEQLARDRQAMLRSIQPLAFSATSDTNSEGDRSAEAIQLDHFELQRLEDDFRELEFNASDESDAEVTTAYAAATLGSVLPDKSTATFMEENATTISSLSSVLNASGINSETVVDTSGESIEKVTLPTKSINEDSLEEYQPSDTLPTCMEDSLTILSGTQTSQTEQPVSSLEVCKPAQPVAAPRQKLTQRGYSRAALSLIPEAEPLNFQNEKKSGGSVVPVTHSNATFCRQLLRNSKDHVPTSAAAKAIFATNTKTADSSCTIDLDQSATAMLSCLHMSDVDELLNLAVEKIGNNNNTGSSNTNSSSTETLRTCKSQTGPSAPAIVPVDRRSIMKQRVARLRQSRTKGVVLDPNRPCYKDEQQTGLENIPPKVAGATTGQPPRSQRENIHRTQQLSVATQFSDCKNEHNQVQSISTSPVSRSTPTVSSLKMLSSNAASTPLLANTNCVMWCGCAPDQINRQQVFVMHHFNTPVTIRFQVTHGREIFKLTDERGYLLSGGHSIRLPPALIYTVHLAYIAQHPLTWNTGLLKLSVAEPEASAWKIRLIGYSNSCQLECFCCTRLGSDVYWTTVVRSGATSLQGTPVSAQSRPSPQSSPLVHNREACVPGRQSDGTGGEGGGGRLSFASVVFTNFGTRSAWLLGVVERLDLVSDLAGANSAKVMSQASGVDAGVTLEPRSMVIGPRQSQSVIITLDEGVPSARIKFYYGDEILRHQLKQHYVVDEETPSTKPNSTAGGHQSRRRPVKLGDLMHGFTNEAPIQIAEIPHCSPDLIRTGDWRQALLHQLSLRRHLTLNVYSDLVMRCPDSGNPASSSWRYTPLGTPQVSANERRSSVFGDADREEFNTVSDLSYISHLPSMTAHAGAFQNRSDRSITAGYSSNLAEVLSSKPCDQRFLSRPTDVWPVLKLEPHSALSFPACDAQTPFTKAGFTLGLTDSTTPDRVDRCWTVLWVAHPISNVQQTSSSPLTCRKLPVEDEVFFSLPPSNHNPNKFDGKHRGILSTTQVSIELPFSFKPLAIDNGENRYYYRQDWLITVWLQPANAHELNSSCIQERHCGANNDLPQHTPARSTFTVTLEGQKTSETSKVPESVRCQRQPHSQQPNRGTHATPRRQGSTRQLGSLLVRGLPVKFTSVCTGESDFLQSTLEVINQSKEITAFVKLSSPKYPFYLLKPNETRFRILPNRCVRLLLAYKLNISEIRHSTLIIETSSPSMKTETGATNQNQLQFPPEMNRLEIPLDVPVG